ncbi:protein of unknown function [Muriicola jejuensis]|uniref:DUF4837 family protein n=1 Tax=Muriicola jejuensis TaxID=504488 RepID=A0A6P0U9E5_9FLAO|nr:DUF4837 family protein [Muriicola jejuensis]NER09921.1 DUF4837 family protein [Muriicola jejuensis]SMP04741.1 protein of unknown function [Muriicola jejuensis]
MRHYFLLLLAVIAVSCNDGPKKTYRPESIGAINSVGVVIENNLWEGPVGDKIREHFAAPVVGLTWDEPVFSLEQMPQKVFTGTTRYRRAVLFVDIDTVNVAHMKSDLYAAPQRIGVIKGRTQEEIIENIDSHADEIIASIKEMELEETQRRFLRSLNKDRLLEEKFGVTFRLPSIYKLGKQEDNFVWIDREIQKGSMNIIAYEIPFNALNNDSTLVVDFIRMRDSIGEKYIPGPDMRDKKTYMTTEDAFAPHFFKTEIDGHQALEVRSIWDMENYPMAGPFATFVIDDEKNDRKLVVEGFTFAPATNKRDYMFELEAILRTIEFKK